MNSAAVFKPCFAAPGFLSAASSKGKVITEAQRGHEVMMNVMRVVAVIFVVTDGKDMADVCTDGQIRCREKFDARSVVNREFAGNEVFVVGAVVNGADTKGHVRHETAARHDIIDAFNAGQVHPVCVAVFEISFKFRRNKVYEDFGREMIGEIVAPAYPPGKRIFIALVSFKKITAR